MSSLPVRECGLKCLYTMQKWAHNVTPRAGVWIEIPDSVKFSSTQASLPVRECGLKCRI